MARSASPGTRSKTAASTAARRSSGYNGFWQGFFRNTVNGGVTFNNNTVVDPDGNEMQTNTFDGGLRCSGNTPAPQQGDSGGSPNHVNGSKTGQCASL